MKSLRDIRLLLKVIQAGSFSAAGRQTGLSPAAVSRRISMLEQELGVRLMYRTSRKLTLTEVGQTFIAKASDIIDRLDELEGLVAEYQQTPRGLLHVHTRVSMGVQFLARALPAFQRRYPDIEVKLWLTEDPQDLIENKIDVAIRLGNLDEPSLAVRRLWDASPRVLVASPSYLDRHPAIGHPNDLLQHNCLTYLDGRFDDGRALWRFRRGGTDLEIRVSGTLQVNNPEVLRQSVLAGCGICLLPIWCYEHDLALGTIVQILPDYSATPSTFDHNFYIVYELSRYVSPKIRVFVEFLVEYFKLGNQTGELTRSVADIPMSTHSLAERTLGKLPSQAE